MWRRAQSSSGPLAGPVSKATSAPSAPIQVTLPTPPRFSTASGFGSSAASAAWNTGTSGAPCPPAATSAERKSCATGRPVSSARVAASPTCQVKPPPPCRAGRCRMVWPWKPIRSASSPIAADRLGVAEGEAADAIREQRVVGRQAVAGAAALARSSSSRRSRRSGVVVGQGQARAEAADPLAVGLHPGGVHAVEGGAAHQPDGSKHRPTVLRGRGPAMQGQTASDGAAVGDERRRFHGRRLPPRGAGARLRPPGDGRGGAGGQAARGAGLGLCRLRLHGRQPACRPPALHHAAAAVPALRAPAGGADRRRHHQGRRPVRQGRGAAAPVRRADRGQQGRHPPLLRELPRLRRRARALMLDNAEWLDALPTSRSCATWGGISASTAC